MSTLAIPSANATPPSIARPPLPTVCFELLEALEKHDQPMAYPELPEHLRNRDLIDVCVHRGLVCYLSRYKGRGGYLGSGTWNENLSAIERDTGTNNLEAYLFLEITSSGHAVLVEHRVMQCGGDEQASYFPNPSAPMTKKDTADAWGGSMTARKLTDLMENGQVRYRQLSRQRFIFSRDDIPNLPRR